MGYRIKELREEMHMTQDELARKAGISRTTIVFLENDEARTTTTKTLFKIANALNTTVDNLFFKDRV